MVIAIEGMDGSGKSSVGKRVAEMLDFMYLDKPLKQFFEILNKNNISVAKVDDKRTNKHYFRIAVQTHNINTSFIRVMNELKKQKQF